LKSCFTSHSDLSRTTKNTTIKTSGDDSPAHVTVNGFPENKTILTTSIPQIRNLQITPVAFRLGIEEISLYKPSNLAASQRAYFSNHKNKPICARN
jgi:hypothetical protein